jgi:glycosyltransferase involved in cell wall biosynthesis
MLVSVIVANYNNAKYLSECFESVLKQTYGKYELIVVDDCSTDNSRDIIDLYEKQFEGRLKKIYQTVNLGAAASRNLALQRSSGDLIAILDSDDAFESVKIAAQVSLFQSDPDLVMCGTGSVWIESDGSKVAGPYLYPESDSELRRNLWSFRKFPAHSSLMFKRSAALKVASYDIRLVPAEDFDLMLKLSKIGKIASIASPLIYYRLHGGNISKKLHKGFTQSHYAIASRILQDPRMQEKGKSIELYKILAYIDCDRIEQCDLKKAELVAQIRVGVRFGVLIKIVKFLISGNYWLGGCSKKRMEQVKRAL